MALSPDLLLAISETQNAYWINRKYRVSQKLEKREKSCLRLTAGNVKELYSRLKKRQSKVQDMWDDFMKATFLSWTSMPLFEDNIFYLVPPSYNLPESLTAIENLVRDADSL